MLSIRNLISFVLAIVATVGALSAQEPPPISHPAGFHAILKEIDGEEVQVANIDINIVPGTDILIGEVSLLDGTVIEDETLMFTPCPCGTSDWYWENARGATGWLNWDHAQGRWVSTVLTGRFEGEVRYLD